ncbi:MAG: hypothetical protein IPH75_12705 [bacterium]|nr:hypothetical protein [bacterium]
MRSLFVWLFALTIFGLVMSLNATDLASSDRISATATVIQPLGMLEIKEQGDSERNPVVARLGTRTFLYIPRGNPILLLDGSPLELDLSRAEHVISMLDVTELLASRKSEHPVVLTVIYSDN